MRTILLIGLHDVRLFLRDRASYVWLLVIPLGFVWAMSLAVPRSGGPADARPRVVVDNRDTGFMGRIFLTELGQQGLTVAGPENAGDARRGITIPPDFTERILATQETKLEYFTIEGADTGESQIVELRVIRVLVAMNARLVRHAIESGNAPPTEEALTALIEAAPAVALKASHAGPKPRPVSFGFSLPGNLVGYTFLNLLIFGGASVAEQRRAGVMRRLAINPVSKPQLVFGKLLGLELLGAVQIAVMLLAGQFIFHVDVADHLPSILLVMLVFSWVAASLGVLVGFLVRAEDKVVGLCLAIALPSAAIGGCWWPLEIAPKFLQQLAHAVPTGWALDALHQLITYGAGFEGIVTPLLVLVAFGAVANAAAWRYFRA